MPKVIQDPGIIRGLIERLRLKGRTPFQLDQTVVPTISVANLDAQAFGIKVGGDSIPVGVGGDFGLAQLENPAGSDVMIVMDSFSGAGDTGAEFWQMRVDSSVLLPSITVSTNRDLRGNLTARAGRIRTDRDPGVLGSFTGVQFETRINETFTLRHQWYLPPGSNILSLQLSPRAIRFYYMWREIPLQLFGL